MYTVEVTRETNENGVFNLYAIGDMHSDRREFNEARFKNYIRHIANDKSAIAVFVGDAMEGRTPGMKHFEIENVRPEFQMKLDSYVKMSLDWNQKLLSPLTKAGVPLVLLEGNHDRYQQYSGYSAMLADRVYATYLGGEGFIRIKTGKKDRYSTIVYATHGSGGGKKPGSKVNNMQETLEWVDADVIIKGHVHDGSIRIVHTYGVPASGGLRLVKTPKVLYRAPSFVERSIQGVVNYAGRHGFSSGDEGLQFVKLDPHSRTAYRKELEINDNPAS